MRPKRLAVLAALAALTATFITGCEGSSSSSSAAAAATEPTGNPGTLLMSSMPPAQSGPGCTTPDFTVTLTPLPASIAASGYTWASSSPNVATVTNGLVHIVGVGQTTIAAQANGTNVVATQLLTVAQCGNTTPSLKIAPDTTLPVGATLTLRRTSNVADIRLNWTSNAPSIVSVDATGTVHALAPGQAVITATAQDYPGLSSSVTITVPQGQSTGVFAVNPLLISAQFAPSGVTTCSTTQPVQITATFNGQPVPASQLSFTPSANATGFTVSNTGLVIFTGQGVANMTIGVVYLPDPTKTAIVAVAVTQCSNGGGNANPIRLILDPATLATFHMGASCPAQQFQWKYNVVDAVTGALISNQNVTFVPSNPNVVSVGVQTGYAIVSARSVGTASITATPQADPTKAVTTQVTVDLQSCTGGTQITINPSYGNVAVGGTATFSVNGVGGTWSSSNQAVLSVGSPTSTGTTSSIIATGIANGIAKVCYAVSGNTYCTGNVIVGTGTGTVVTIQGPTSGRIGTSTVYTATVTGPVNTAVDFTSSRPSVIDINIQTGVARFIGTGTATICAVSRADQTKGCMDVTSVP